MSEKTDKKIADFKKEFQELLSKYNFKLSLGLRYQQNAIIPFAEFVEEAKIDEK